MIRILHVKTGLSGGDAEAALFRLCSFGGDSQHVVISLTDNGKYGDLLEDAGIKFHRLDMPREGLSFQGLFKLRRLFREIKPDVVQTWMYHADLIGGIAARGAGIRAVCRAFSLILTPNMRKAKLLVLSLYLKA